MKRFALLLTATLVAFSLAAPAQASIWGVEFPVLTYPGDATSGGGK